MATQPQRCSSDSDCNANKLVMANASHYKQCINGICGTFPLAPGLNDGTIGLIATASILVASALGFIIWWWFTHR